MNRINILGVNISKVTMNQAIEKVLGFMDTNGKYEVYTPNPEMVMMANKDKLLMSILNEADLVVPDGIGIVIASKLLSRNLHERVAGYDLVQNIFNELKNTDKKVYFLGGAPGVAKKAAECMREKHIGLNIVGTRDGYFKENEEQDIITEINELKPDLLLVGLGIPKQEKWINKNKNKIEAKVSIGVGGSFDVMSGNIKRAPEVFQKLGLEWFYRLALQPSRAKRMLELPKFLVEVLKRIK